METKNTQQQQVDFALLQTPYLGVQNCMTARFTKSKGRRIRGLSMTVPDQTMTLRQIIDRFSRGLPITGNGVEPTWTAEEDSTYMGVDFRTLDLAERMDIIKGYSEAITAHETRIRETASKNARERLKAEIKAEFEAELAREKSPKEILPDNQKIE